MAVKEDRVKWINVYKDMTKKGIQRSFLSKRHYSLAKDKYTATKSDHCLALAMAIRDRVIERWINTQQRYHKQKVKRVYYLSMEFLIGRLLGTNLLNLGLMEKTREAMEELGIDLEELRETEQDAGLGNGGLGRLAACFLDSMATLGIPATGYGIRYEYGIFNQKIVNGYQVEYPDEWLRKGNPWEFQRPEYVARVKLYGRTQEFRDSQGKRRVKWVDAEEVLAMPYDMPVAGYKNGVVNNLRLWSARSSEEFDLSYFNSGDYEGAVYNKVFSENISKVLYPNDNVSQGKELRLKQEYFFTAASIADIVRRYKVDHTDIRRFAEGVAIQLNDTHPSIAIVELLRRLLDEENLEWDEAWDIVVKTFAYTNHTVMPEALETWPVSLFATLLPRHLELIYEINTHFLKDVAARYPGDFERLARMSLIEEGEKKKIRMAHLSIVGSHSINGVSELHTHILKTQIFKDFYEFFPERFNNKTNGITQRRWLLKANARLSHIITDAIGDKWTTDLYHLEKLLRFKDDKSFHERWQNAKRENKSALANYISSTTGIVVNPNSLFDVQVKRLHEYKRQVLFCLYIISQYLEAKKEPHSIIVPRTFILGGKAAPGYFMAKLIIKFINNIAYVINRNKAVNNKFKVVFLEDYRVSLAEKIFPASELSEQISAAGMEASGTGCMKFMVNGALSICTPDGANLEMAREVGEENIFLLGLTYKGVQELFGRGYNPQEFIERSPVLKEVLNLIKSNFFSQAEPDIFRPIVDGILQGDRFLIAADFDAYCAMQKKVSENYINTEDWTRKSIINVAKSGKFSSDRAIREYAKEIWNVPYYTPSV